MIKTHLSIDMLPKQVIFSKESLLKKKPYFKNPVYQVLEKKAKVIYVTRNPRDAVVRMISSEKEGTFL